MIWIVLLAILSIYFLYTSIKTEHRVTKSGKDLRLDLSIGFYDAILGCETEVRIPRLEAISDDAAIQVIRLLKIMIPAGVDCGTKLRLKGEGDASKYGGRAGDLFIQVLAPLQDGELRRKGMNIESEVKISKEQAYTGCEVFVRTVWGEMKIVITPRSRNGDTIILKGCGVSKAEMPTKRGDHIIYLLCEPM
jgi:DnaJ-class molecular chaperone